MEPNPYQSPVMPGKQPQPRVSGRDDYDPVFATFIAVLAIPWLIVTVATIVEKIWPLIF